MSVNVFKSAVSVFKSTGVVSVVLKVSFIDFCILLSVFRTFFLAVRSVCFQVCMCSVVFERCYKVCKTSAYARRQTGKVN